MRRTTTNSNNGKPDKFDIFDAPKHYHFQKNKQKCNPRQTSINRQSQLDRWFTFQHKEEPTAIKLIKLSQQQKKKSKNSKVSINQRQFINIIQIKQIKQIQENLNDKKQLQVNQNKKQLNNDQSMKIHNLRDDKKLKEKNCEPSKTSKNIFQNKEKNNNNNRKSQKFQVDKQKKQKADKLIKQYQVPKPIKLSKPKININNKQKQNQSKLSKDLQKNPFNQDKKCRNQKYQNNTKNVSAPKSMTVLQATFQLNQKNLKNNHLKYNGPHPCQYPIRIQRQWEAKSKRKWYSLSEQSKKKAEESMKKMKRQTRPKEQQANKPFYGNVIKKSKTNIFNKNNNVDTKQFDL